MHRIRAARIGQPQAMAAGPPPFQPLRERGEATGQDRDDREGDGEVGEPGPRPAELLFVPELGQELFVGPDPEGLGIDLADLYSLGHGVLLLVVALAKVKRMKRGPLVASWEGNTRPPGVSRMLHRCCGRVPDRPDLRRARHGPGNVGPGDGPDGRGSSHGAGHRAEAVGAGGPVGPAGGPGPPPRGHRGRRALRAGHRHPAGPGRRLRDFTVIEQSDGVGGTWRDNTYPGSGCDVPSHLYSFSFASKSDWTRRFADQPEILSYAEQLRRPVHASGPTSASAPRCAGSTLRRGRSAAWRIDLDLAGGAPRCSRPTP